MQVLVNTILKDLTHCLAFLAKYGRKASNNMATFLKTLAHVLESSAM